MSCVLNSNLILSLNSTSDTTNSCQKCALETVDSVSDRNFSYALSKIPFIGSSLNVLAGLCIEIRGGILDRG